MIDDSVLLFLHERYVRRAIKKWQEEKLSDDSASPVPGGPEQFFEDRGQRELLHRLFDDLLGEDYIESVCERLNLQKMQKPVKKY